MPKIRISHPIDPKLDHDCDRMHLESYEISEVTLPASTRREEQKAFSIVIHGRNLRVVADPVYATVGKLPVKFLRFAPDERSLEGVLLEEPRRGILRRSGHRR